MKWLQVITGAAVLLLAAFGTWSHVQRIDAQVAERYSDNLQSLLALNFRLTGEVLKARSGSVGHYDGIVQTEAALRRVHEQLRTVPPFLDAEDAADLAATVDRSARLFQHTRDLVERFKQENAVLRNSLRYLAAIAAEIDRPVDKGPKESLVLDALDTLVRDELLLQGWHDQSILERVTQDIDKLRAAVATTTHVDPERLAIAVTHVQLVRERTAEVNHLTRLIVEQPTVTAAQTIITKYARHHRRALAAMEQRNVVTFALAMVTLALAAASVIARLGRSARELRTASEQLATANAALQVEQARQQELNQLKSRFVSMTSHEFRTPLSTILSSSDMLAAYVDRWSEEKRQDHFTRIRDAVLSMTRMLDGILMIGRSEAGMLTFSPGTVDLVRVCASAIEAASTNSRAEHEIIYEGPTTYEPAIADEALLRNVLDNLLSNAIKYSPEGGPVTLSLKRQDQLVMITVRDQGLGIPARDTEHLFETFRRGSNVGTIAGSGLGLAVVKRAVELQGGTLSFESEVGHGSTFRVQVPCPRFLT